MAKGHTLSNARLFAYCPVGRRTSYAVRTAGWRGYPIQQRVTKSAQDGVARVSKLAYWRAFSDVFGWKCPWNGDFPDHCLRHFLSSTYIWLQD